MRLKSIQLKHTTLFQDLKVNFEYDSQPITIILGDQTTGKTTLLKNIYHALTWFSARLKDVRSAGVVMPDADVKLSRVQSKLQIEVEYPDEIGNLPESASAHPVLKNICSWSLFKTLNTNGLGTSHVETQQLEQLVQLYLSKTKLDPYQGLPLIAYYPSERFVNEINLQSKNNPAVLHALSAYDLTITPFTTFIRFFEWIREISDIENAQASHIVQRLVKGNFSQIHQTEILQDIQNELSKVPAQLTTPSLYALKTTLHTVFPELTDLYIEYQPKLQLMVHYRGQTLPFQQLSSSLKTWIALVGDIVRRLCLLNARSLHPCLEGEGVLLIDQIDLQLDHENCTLILERLQQAFPLIQMIVTGTREELLDYAERYQCLRLTTHGISPIHKVEWQDQLSDIYQNLDMEIDQGHSTYHHTEAPQRQVDEIFQLIQGLNEQQRDELLQLLQLGDPQQETESPL